MKLPIITDMAAKKEDLADISITLRRTRKMAGLSQNELAELAGVGKTLVFDLEKGHESIRLNNLKKILHVLNIGITLEPPDLLSENPKSAEKSKRKTRK